MTNAFLDVVINISSLSHLLNGALDMDYSFSENKLLNKMADYKNKVIYSQVNMYLSCVVLFFFFKLHVFIKIIDNQSLIICHIRTVIESMTH